MSTANRLFRMATGLVPFQQVFASVLVCLSIDLVNFISKSILGILYLRRMRNLLLSHRIVQGLHRSPYAPSTIFLHDNQSFVNTYEYKMNNGASTQACLVKRALFHINSRRKLSAGVNRGYAVNPSASLAPSWFVRYIALRKPLA